MKIELIEVVNHGFSMYSCKDGTVGNAIYARRDYEPVTTKLFIQSIELLDAVGAFVFLDIGAHHGYYSMLCSHYAPHSKIYAYEPTLESFEVLQKNLSKRENCCLRQDALSDNSKPTTLVSLHTDPACNKLSNTYKKGQVSIVPKLLSMEDIDFDKVKIVKIDIEGKEMAVVKEAWHKFKKDTIFIIEKNGANIAFAVKDAVTDPSFSDFICLADMNMILIK